MDCNWSSLERERERERERARERERERDDDDDPMLQQPGLKCFNSLRTFLSFSFFEALHCHESNMLLSYQVSRTYRWMLGGGAAFQKLLSLFNFPYKKDFQ